MSERSPRPVTTGTQQHDLEPSAPAEVADPVWFRAPNPREHIIAAGLFVGFGLFFAMLFLVNRGWWFRWIILVLAVWSLTHGLRHVLGWLAAKAGAREGSSQ